MKREILEVLSELHTNGYLDWMLNTTFITLISKKEGEKTVHDFRPISLLAGVYKIIGKILASRLKTVMSALISDYQSGGLEERNTRGCVDSK